MRRGATAWVLAGVLGFFVPAPARAGEIAVENNSELRAALASARPGTQVELAPGTYSGGVTVRDLHGTAERPIVIAGPAAGEPARLDGGTTALHLVDCSYVTVRHITVSGCTGNGINVDDGGTKDTPSHHVRIEGVTIRDIGPRGNHDGLKLSGLEDFAIVDCRFEGWGGSAIDMVGCHRGVVDGCTLLGKEGFSQASGIQMKGGTRDVTVLRCFFHEAGQRAVNLGGSTGLESFRPEDARFEAEAITVEGNRFVGSQAPVAFVNARGGRVRQNTIYLPAKWVLRVLQESRGERFPPCRECTFEKNLVVYDERVRVAVNVGPGTDAESFTFSGNAWFATGGGRTAPPALPAPEKDGIHGVDPRLTEPGTAGMRITSKDRRLRGVGADAFTFTARDR